MIPSLCLNNYRCYSIVQDVLSTLSKWSEMGVKTNDMLCSVHTAKMIKDVLSTLAKWCWMLCPYQAKHSMGCFVWLPFKLIFSITLWIFKNLICKLFHIVIQRPKEHSDFSGLEPSTFHISYTILATYCMISDYWSPA